jgi:capsular polysaccharide biosynthesis protein
MLNEDEIEEKMTQLGFAVVHPEELTFDEQVTMFSRARVIVGPHGAGMTNAVFSPSSCLIVDFYPDTCYTLWLVQLTHLFDHYHLPICYLSDRSQSQPVLLNGEKIQVTHVYRAPPDDLGDAIVKAMRLLNIRIQTVGSVAN